MGLDAGIAQFSPIFSRSTPARSGERRNHLVTCRTDLDATKMSVRSAAQMDITSAKIRQQPLRDSEESFTIANATPQMHLVHTARRTI
jgi:hypothetical protein